VNYIRISATILLSIALETFRNLY